VTAAAITASATLVVALIAFTLNQWSSRRTERRRARLDHINAQIRLLYGPLNALVDSNEAVWMSLREKTIPSSSNRNDQELNAEQRQTWRLWLDSVLMPTNRKMRDLIVGNAELFIEPSMPEPFRAFCAHVAAYEVLLAGSDNVKGLGSLALIKHPGERYVMYVRQSFVNLKSEQQHLLD
jgi:hypothetical protein